MLVTGPGPYYAPLADFDFDEARRDIDAHLLLPLQVARSAVGRVRAGGTLLFIGRHRRPARRRPGSSLIAAITAAMPALTKNLALELAPIRVNLIAAGFVDTPLSAAILGDQLDARREQLRSTLPIRRVVGPGRHRRAGRPSDGQHRRHRRDVRHRRRPAARGAVTRIRPRRTLPCSPSPGPRAPLGAIACGVAASALGTLAMDLVPLPALPAASGGESGFGAWESSAGLDSWDDAPAPAKVGKRMVESRHAARSVAAPRASRQQRHALGLRRSSAGAQFGLLAGSLRSPKLGLRAAVRRGRVGGGLRRPAALGVYRPIWEYDLETLGKDLSAHLVFGTATAARSGRSRRAVPP